VEAEALMLEVLSDFQVTIPELGTITATRRPMVFLTSNDTRDLSEALKRRCLYLHLDYPTVQRERAILLARVAGLSADLATQIAGVVRQVRDLDLRKRPSISESLDWARTLVLLGIESIEPGQAVDTLQVLLKYEADIEKARRELLGLPNVSAAAPRPAPVDAFRYPEGQAG
jgi:MoxR-like ATPase